MNRDEGSAYDRFLDTASSRRVKNRKNVFLWARKVVFTSFQWEIMLRSFGVSMKSEVVITSGKVGQADSIPSFRVGKTWRLSIIWRIKYFNLYI